jgi:ABC-type Fe3+/spermidine/putrescine transport system ATPase subunit
LVEIKLENITKRFGDVTAAGEINLVIKDGEFFTFLGPSGCGKTTTMRIVAGLEYPDSGTIHFDDRDITDLPSYKRNTGMVFQNYALWPHMKVFDNIAYGLKVRGVQREEIRKRVNDVLELVKLPGLGDRYPNQLSGGQQQRVALARVLVVNPSVLLLDEPLSNLDAKLRVEMREEIKEIQMELGITTIYVTHDQEEAMAISDRVAIQNNGYIEQVDPPKDIYNKPKNLFVGTFIGRGNLLEGEAVRKEPTIEVKVNNIRLMGVNTGDNSIQEGDPVACILRPENFSVREPNQPFNELVGDIEWTAFVGPVTEIKLNLDGKSLMIDAPPGVDTTIGEKLRVYIPIEDTIILPLEE